MFALCMSEYICPVEGLRSPRYFQAQSKGLDVPKWEQFQIENRKSRHSHCYFLGRASTRAEIAEFFSVPPTINGPKGVNTMPWVSARTS